MMSGLYKRHGMIHSLDNDHVHVPKSQRTFFDNLKEQTGNDARHTGPPRYAVTLAIGKRFEPYILSVRPL